MKHYQPRYVAYAAAHGLTPIAMLARDRQDWPGGCMAGFMLWTRERWAEWSGCSEPAHRSAADHEAFDAWLARLLTA